MSKKMSSTSHYLVSLFTPKHAQKSYNYYISSWLKISQKKWMGKKFYISSQKGIDVLVVGWSSAVFCVQF